MLQCTSENGCSGCGTANPEQFPAILALLTNLRTLCRSRTSHKFLNIVLTSRSRPRGCAWHFLFPSSSHTSHTLRKQPYEYISRPRSFREERHVCSHVVRILNLPAVSDSAQWNPTACAYAPHYRAHVELTKRFVPPWPPNRVHRAHSTTVSYFLQIAVLHDHEWRGERDERSHARITRGCGRLGRKFSASKGAGQGMRSGARAHGLKVLIWPARAIESSLD